MELKEAITSIGKQDGNLSPLAREALELNDFKPFVKHIKNLFNNGWGASLTIFHTHEVIDTIIKSK